MARKVIHVTFTRDNTNEYYASLTALFTFHSAKELGVSQSTLQKHDTTKDYVNPTIRIVWGKLLSKSDHSK